MNDSGGILALVVVVAVIGGLLYLMFRPQPAKWCDACGRVVTPQKPFNWLVFIFLCGIFYLPIWLMGSAKCPICKGNSFSDPQSRKAKA